MPLHLTLALGLARFATQFATPLFPALFATSPAMPQNNSPAVALSQPFIESPANDISQKQVPLKVIPALGKSAEAGVSIAYVASSATLPHVASPTASLAQPLVEIPINDGSKRLHVPFEDSIPTSGSVEEKLSIVAKSNSVLTNASPATSSVIHEIGQAQTELDDTTEPNPSATSFSVSMPHPYLAMVDPAPSLPSSVDPEYVKQMMAINLSVREAAWESFRRNPFYPFDDIIFKALKEIDALDIRFPECKSALAKLRPPSGGSNY
ncbi:hypothetical protein L0F63_005369 [Massospora cicadina]|nr:hypothetical protein L0F63_005369 [Massospora cicadina]